MRQKGQYQNTEELADFVSAARGLQNVDLVIKDTTYLDVFSGSFFHGDVAVYRGKIVGLGPGYEGEVTLNGRNRFLVPGFIDTHVHIESSMMTPARFEEAVLNRGTTTAIWDPHEIANVKGQRGIEWAIAASEGLRMDIFVMIPSCVPSTSPELKFETSGATLRAEDLRSFQHHPRILGLAEMMNFPGLLNGELDVLQKIHDFSGMRRDGHCPSLAGKDLNGYAVAGVHSCHESTGIEEAREKMRKGIRVLIREGSCAKDAQTLLPLVNSHTSTELGLCSDDRNPLDINNEGHIDFIVNMALKRGIAAENIFRVASYAAARAYGLEDRGAIAPGYLADMIMVAQATPGTWIDGMIIDRVFKAGRGVDVKKHGDITKTASSDFFKDERNLHLSPVSKGDLLIVARDKIKEKCEVRVIGVKPNQILTDDLRLMVPVENGECLPDLNQDVLKIAVFERHKGCGDRSVAFVRGFGITRGAIATSINHDCHNVIVVGSSDEMIVRAVNTLIEIDGGIVVVSEHQKVTSLPLPIGGLMTEESPESVAKGLSDLKDAAQSIGCVLEEPFLQLSFLALPVIPSLKITDQGLIDVIEFKKVELMCDVFI